MGIPLLTGRASNEALTRALLRGLRWRDMRERERGGRSVRELAAREKTDPSCLARPLRLNALAPEIVETILRGTAPDIISLEGLRGGIPLEWEEQRWRFGKV